MGQDEIISIRNIIRFFKEDLWRIQLKNLPRKRSFLLRQLRIIVLAVRGFVEDKCSLRASALTFYSLLSVVPAVALAFGIAKGFGMQKLLEKTLIEKMKGQEEVITYIINFSGSMLENAKGGLIAGVGVALLLWLIIKLLGNIEKSFNDIWGVMNARSIGRKITDYLSVSLVAPIMFIMASSITVFITTQITRITERLDLLGPISPLILFSIKIFPYCVIWLLFTFIYMFMPNTKVSFRAGLLGGVVAGTIFVVVQWIYIAFQVGVSRYGAIYGSFAVLPLFMIWLQASWMIVLLGTEISFAYQHVETYEFEPESLQVSPSFKRLLALRIVHLCVRKFVDGEKPWTAGEIAKNMEIPIRLTNQILYELVQCNILSETIGENEKDPLYQPARDVNSLDIHFVIRSLDKRGSRDIPLRQTEEIERISRYMAEFDSIVDKSDANLLLKDI